MLACLRQNIADKFQKIFKIFYIFFGYVINKSYLCGAKKIENLLRGGAVVARWAHNPKVVGSSPAPATKESPIIL